MAGKPTVTRPRSLRAKAAPAEPSLGFSWGRNNWLLLGAGLLLLVAGYVSLAHGSLTLAPLLLVTGYCVLIPASLLVSSGGPNSGE